MKKLRLSYSLLDTWMRGRKDDAIQLYLRMNGFKSQAMQRGSDFDKYCKEYIKKNEKLPPELGGEKLNHPIPAFELIASYNNEFDLKLELDCLDAEDIVEIKNSTASDSAEFSTTLQIPFYFLVLELQKLPCSKARVYRYNPQTKKYDMTIIHKNRRMIDEARKAIEKHGPQIWDYFEQEGIL